MVKKIILVLIFSAVIFPAVGRAQLNLPFAGLTGDPQACLFPLGYFFIKITPPLPNLPFSIMYKPGEAKTYQFYQIPKENVCLIGTYDVPLPCLIGIGGHSASLVGVGWRVVMVGTSQVYPAGSQTCAVSGAGPTNPPIGPILPPISPDQCKRMGTNPNTYAARGTGYFPDSSAMEGGFEDMQGKPLRTLQQFLAGQASYVSVAMDTGVFPYGTELCIPQLEQKYNRQIPFRVVDTGSAFTGHGTTRIDICTANSGAAGDGTINGALQLVTKTAAKK